MTNTIIRIKQLTETIHVHDLKFIHVDPRVNDDFIQFIDWKNGDPYIVEVKATGRKIHNYLGMTLKYYDKWTLKIGMRDYVKQMINYLPIKLDKNDTVTTPASEELLKISNRNILSKEKADTFHTITTKCMFLCKREIPDIQPII